MRSIFWLVAGLALSGNTMADEFGNLSSLTAEQYASFSDDLAVAMAFRGVQPAEPFGIVGFDAGVNVGSISVGSEGSWNAAGSDPGSSLLVSQLYVNKGLPFGFDIGASLTRFPGTELDAWGAQLRYAISEGGVVTPAIGLRFAMSRMEGSDQLEYSTRSVDLSISKGFGPLTPYAGYGRVWGDATPAAASGLPSRESAMNKAFVGARFSLLLLEFAVEAERIGDADSYWAKIGFGF